MSINSTSKTYQVPRKIAKPLHPLDEIRRIVKKHHIKGLTPQEIKEYINYGRK